MKITHSLIPVILCTLGLSACTSTDKTTPQFTEFDPADPRIGKEVKRVCRGTGVDGFGETTRNTVVVSTSVNQQHILKVASGCFNLKNAQSIAMDQFSNCLSRGDSLIAYESIFGPNQNERHPIKCRITNIYEYDKDAIKNLDSQATEPETDIGN